MKAKIEKILKELHISRDQILQLQNNKNISDITYKQLDDAYINICQSQKPLYAMINRLISKK